MISLKNVSVNYPIYNTSEKLFRKNLVRLCTGGVLFNDSSGVYVKALEDISIEFHEGEIVGLVGHNGSGKTTMLRVLAGIYPPTNGYISIKGSVTTLFEVGAGLEAELTGVDNIKRLLTLFNFDFKQRDFKDIVNDIATKSGLGIYIYMPVRTYSAGMNMRLIFTIATYKDPEILLIDEIFAVGDGQFSEYSENRLKEMRERSRLTVIASQNMNLLRKICNRIIKLESGKIIDIVYE